MTKIKRAGGASLAFVAALTLSACGGGGGGNGGGNGAPLEAGPTAEGVYTGTLTSNGVGNSNAFELVVLEDGSYWALYGQQVANVLEVAGFVQGAGTSNNGSYTSSTGADFGFDPAKAITLSATYTATPTVAGTISYGGGVTATFSGGAPTGTLYSYDAPASLGNVSGTWPVSLTDGETASVTVSPSGALAGLSSGGCQFTGTVKPRASGKNVFDVSIVFGTSFCVLAGQTTTGIAIEYGLEAGGNELDVAVINSGGTLGIAAFGNR